MMREVLGYNLEVTVTDYEPTYKGTEIVQGKKELRFEYFVGCSDAIPPILDLIERGAGKRYKVEWKTSVVMEEENEDGR